MRGFYTDPARADDSFIPFKSIDNAEYTFDLTAYTTSVSNYSTTKIELSCKNYKLLSRTKLEESAVGTNEVIAYKNDGTKVTLSNDTSDLLNVDISDYVRLEAYMHASYHYGRFKFKLILLN